MLRKIANLTHRIGGMEGKTEDFENKRMKNLQQNQNLFAGEITPESIELDRRPLENYVKFYYEKLDEIEQILTENLQKICYALDLMEYFEDLKIEIEKQTPANLKNKEIDRARVPKWLNYVQAMNLKKEINDSCDQFESEIRKELEDIQIRGRSRDRDQTFYVITEYSPRQLQKHARKIAFHLASDQVLMQEKITELQLLKALK